MSKVEEGLAGAANKADAAAGGTGARASAGQARMFVAPSSGSMQLALESKAVVDATAPYLEALSKIIEDKSDAVGYVYAINGKLNSAEVYSSNDLFRRMWLKLLRASATEALADRGNTTVPATDSSTVRRWLADAELGRESSLDGKGRLLLTRKETDTTILFETRNGDLDAEWIHRSYVTK